MQRCSVDGCDKPVKRPTTGYCYGHYMKNWRYGTPTPAHPSTAAKMEGKRFGSLVVIEHQGRGYWLCRCDCGKTRSVMSGILNRGSALTCGDRKVHYRQDYVAYCTAHDRVHNDRGNAKNHDCVDCGSQAHEWSYNHQDPDELISADHYSRGAPYSLDVNNYEPRCRTCHRRFDRAHIRATRSRSA